MLRMQRRFTSDCLTVRRILALIPQGVPRRPVLGRHGAGQRGWHRSAVGFLDIRCQHGVQSPGMAARATWKGFLKISLVNIPIKVFPATESSGTISFHQLHGECQTRIQQKRWCPHHNREVPSSEIVKAYEFEKGRYVVLSEEDFDKVRPESTRVIDLVQFADDSAIDPTYIDRAY